MNTKTTMLMVMMIGLALATGPQAQALQPVEPADAAPSSEEPTFSELTESCCSKCRDSAEKLCKGGKVKNFNCGGFPCECSFECANGYGIDAADLVARIG